MSAKEIAEQNKSIRCDRSDISEENCADDKEDFLFTILASILGPHFDFNYGKSPQVQPPGIFVGKNPMKHIFLPFLFSCLVLVSLPAICSATNPAGGSLSPTSTTALTFVGTAPGTGADSEPDGIEGVNKDTYVLTVSPGVYTGKLISVTLSWTNSANDRDLYVFKRNPDGSNGQQVAESAGGAPQTGEATSFDPNIYGTGQYNVEIIYFACTPNLDQPTGSIALFNAPVTRQATYTTGGMGFSKNSPCKAPTAFADTEPSSRVDAAGNAYVCGIEGVPAGVDLWYFDLRPTLPNPTNPANPLKNPTYDPSMRVPIYRGKPDSPSSAAGQAQLQAGALGGGDIDLAVGFGNYSGDGGLGLNAAPNPVLAYSSLTAANVTVGRSLDLGKTFQFNPVGNAASGVPINDRQWMGFLDDHTVYLEYRNFAQGIAFVQQSTNGGLTYGPATLVGNLPQTGACDVDRFDGTVYISGDNGQVAVGTPASPGAAPSSYTINQATPSGVNVANLFFPIRVAADHRQFNADGSYTLTSAGTVYGVYSDGANLYLIHSLDHGAHWSAPVRVNNPADANLKLNIFPWLAAGPTPGTVGIVWYATNSATNNDNARWHVYFAQTFNATSDVPNFQYVRASDHTNHAANISLSGLVLTGGPNRNLSDYFQVNFDPVGAAQIAYTDDHNDFAGAVFVTRQISGPSINAKLPNASQKVPSPTAGSALPAQPFAVPGATPATIGAPAPQPMQPGPNGEQVTDFAQDQDSGLLATTPTNSPLDIISIKYVSQTVSQNPIITATMKVSDLGTMPPPNTTWRMFFAANAPETGIITISGNSYSKGLSDRGDQFYIQAATNAQGVASFTWGTAARNFSGGINTTAVGTADSGGFDSVSGQITVTISVSKLNAYLTSVHHKLIKGGAVMCGLRGQSFQTNTSGIALEDYTRGGTEFTIASF